MQTHPAKRIEIVIERPLLRRLTAALDSTGLPGYTVLPVWGGSGRSGPWTREGQVSAAGGMACVTIIAEAELAERALEQAFALVERHIGIVSMTDCEVVRPDRFAARDG
ncbi:P-II family nitrogen regulator [Roseobacter sp. HKCCA0434]|uniref:P-II family nitrogen regulator n=1 Tax=Roseobacter sp. HKCCA0434 TaxID=3079297 RepID=UPI002905A90B|nr:transcriptional regulator [Roseobacter sp. HKCCA0434]